MRDLPLNIILLRIALTCLVVLIAIGIDNLIFHLFDLWESTAFTIASIGFVALVAGAVTSIWSNDF